MKRLNNKSSLLKQSAFMLMIIKLVILSWYQSVGWSVFQSIGRPIDQSVSQSVSQLQRVCVVASMGRDTQSFGGPLASNSAIRHLVVKGEGNIFVADYDKHKVLSSSTFSDAREFVFERDVD